jgi:hypothetical protein
MRSVVLAIAALSLSAGAFAQSQPPALPRCMQEAPPVNVDVKDVSVAKVLPFLGASCGIEIRVEDVEGTEATRTLQSVRFQQAKVTDIFQMLVQASRLKYTVVDDKTIVVTKQ